ncbi:MAG: hypothetical protein AABY06_03275 [Nanoarchaeota archaeon]
MVDVFLKEVILYVAGKPAESIADVLSTKTYINEFLIAKKIGLVINQTRNILYKLSDSGLVSSIRKKDKKKGWYTYFWKIEALKSLEFLNQILLKQIEQINNQINTRESKQFYVCDRCNIELTGERALLYNFTCNECGEIFKIKDNLKLLKELKKNLEKLKNKFSSVKGEIEKEKEKIEKIKIIENKKLAKKTLVNRKEAAAVRKEEKNKMNKIGKDNPKKSQDKKIKKVKKKIKAKRGH